MAVTNLSVGSKGEDVKKLQEALINAGYDVGKTGADGVIGKNTEAAIRQYQKDNGLQVDGIAGKNTLGSLYGTTANNTAPPAASKPPAAKPPAAKTEPEAPAPSAPEAPTTNVFAPSDETIAAGQRKEELSAQKPGDFTWEAFTDPEIVVQANTLLQEWLAGKPGDYTPVWQDEADAYLSQYQNRDPFSYDFNSDALYNQYKDQYIQQGRMAMMDTMGQAAAMTGGYGNSYAQTVGQQAYNQQLGQLNEIMPQLYGMARDQYNQEGQNLLDMYGLYMDRENQEYGRYQDNLNNWYTHLDYLSDDAKTKREQAYNAWLDTTNMNYKQWQDTYNSWLDEYNQADEDYWNLYNRDYGIHKDSADQAYKEGRDAVADEQWQKTFDYNAGQDAKAEAESKRVNEYNRLANLISSSGHVPTVKELDAAGMTKAEADALLNGYNAPKAAEYRDLEPGSTAYNLYEKKVKNAATPEALLAIVNEMQKMKYDPEIIEALTKAKAAELLPEEPEQPPKKGTGAVGGIGGGGGGGVTRWEIK